MKSFKIITCFTLVTLSSYGTAQEIEFSKPSYEPLPYSPIPLRELPSDKTAPLVLPPAVLIDTQSQIDSASHRMYDEGFGIFKKIDPSDIQGRPISVGTYVGEINHVEKALNEQGQSLRHGASVHVDLKQAIDTPKFVQQLAEAVDAYRKDLEENYEKQRRAAELSYQQIEAELRSSKEPRKNPNAGAELYLQSRDDQCTGLGPTMEGAVKCFLSDEKAERRGIDPLTDPSADQCEARSTPLGRPVLIGERWDDAGGDKAFGWVGNAKFALKTDRFGLQVVLDSQVEAMAVGHSKVIFRGHADFISPGTGAASSDRFLELFGKKVLAPPRETLALSLANSKNTAGEEQYLFHQEQNIASTTIVVGFVPVVMSLDAKTEAGPQYALDLVPVKIKGQAESTGQVTVIASAGVGADFKLFSILAGIKGYLDLISATIGVYPEASLYLDNQDRPQISGRLIGLSRLKTLSGEIEIGVWAKSAVGLPMPSGEFPFVEVRPVSYSWTNTIGNYPGYDIGTAVLFDKKVGYDICSGRRTEETLVASVPRASDLQTDFTMQESLRVERLASAFDDFFDLQVGSESDMRVRQRLDQASKDFAQNELAVRALAAKILANPESHI